MSNNEEKYISKLKQIVYDHISADIKEKAVDKIVKIDLVNSHIEDKASAGFQDYYFLILNNEKLYNYSTDFFRQFKKGIHFRALTTTTLISSNDIKRVFYKKFEKTN